MSGMARVYAQAVEVLLFWGILVLYCPNGISAIKFYGLSLESCVDEWYCTINQKHGNFLVVEGTRMEGGGTLSKKTFVVSQSLARNLHTRFETRMASPFVSRK